MSSFSPEAAQAGRLAMKAKCIEVALAETPPEVLYIKVRKALSGCAYPDHIEAPRPFTRRALYIYLHEVAHVVLDHNVPKVRRKLKSWQREEQAEAWAAQTMRAHGIAVPRKETRRAKQYVAHKKEVGRKCSHRHKWVDFPVGTPQHGEQERCADPDCYWMRPKRKDSA